MIYLELLQAEGSSSDKNKCLTSVSAGLPFGVIWGKHLHHKVKTLGHV